MRDWLHPFTPIYYSSESVKTALHPDVLSVVLRRAAQAGWHGSVHQLAERAVIFSAFQGSFHQLGVHKRSDQSSIQLASCTTRRGDHRLTSKGII